MRMASLTGVRRVMVRLKGSLILYGFMLLLFSKSGAQQLAKISFPVHMAGDSLEYAFAGGMDAPQFSQVDLNRDGLQDVFVFDRQGNTAIPFITTFHEGVFGYEIQWSMLEHLPALQNWVLILDFNNDGIEDLFASTNVPGVQGIDVYRGRIEEDKLAFKRMIFDVGGQFDMLHFILNPGFTPLYAAWIDVPAIKDIDGDGDVDVLSFEPGGSYVHYFKNLALENGLGVDTFLLDWDDVCWGKFYENAFSEQVELSPSPGQCASGTHNFDIQVRHSGSTCFASDVDADGDQDLFLGDLSSRRIKLLFNGGTSEQAWITSEDNAFPSTDIPVDIPFFVAPFVLDINHDGIDDVIAASNNTGFSENYDVAWYYRNDGSGSTAEFHLEETALFVSEMIDFGSDAKPTFIDVDEDGLLDILIGTGGFYTPEGARDARLILMRNSGTPTQPAFEIVDEDFLGFSAFVSIPTWEFSPAAGDIDKDGDVDLLVGERNGGLFFVENIAGPGVPAEFIAPVYPYATINVGTSSTPALVDLNGDGLLDVVCGERIGNNDKDGRCSNLNYFQNIGSAGNAQFMGDPTQTPNTQCLGRVIFNTNPAIPEYSAPSFILTPDGLRLVSGSESGKVRIYKDIENMIGGTFVSEDGDYGNIADGGRIVPALADLNADGFYEMTLGNKRGGLTIYTTDFQVMPTAVIEIEKPGTDIRLIPNPSYGIVTLQIGPEPDVVSVSSVQIRDMHCRLVGEYRDVTDGDKMHLKLAPGLYVISLVTESQKFIQKLIIL